jgi:CheY-like chemotaxis protein
MPGRDGWGVLAEIRKTPGLEMTPVIAVTASQLLGHDAEHKEQLSGYVRKPFSKRELFDELAQFLPREAKPKPEVEMEWSLEPSNGVGPELVTELRRLLSDEWPGVRDSLAINECKAFAARLDELDRLWPCRSLHDYAHTLKDHAEAYAVVELETHLREFPALVEQLEHTVPA